jgi:hypothetical protein
MELKRNNEDKMKTYYHEPELIKARLTDGSLVYSVKWHNLEFDCFDRKAAQQLVAALADGVLAYTRTDI